MLEFGDVSGRVVTRALLFSALCAPIGLLAGCGDSAQESGSPAVVNQKEVDAAQKGMQEFMAKKQGGKAASKP